MWFKIRYAVSRRVLTPAPKVPGPITKTHLKFSCCTFLIYKMLLVCLHQTLSGLKQRIESCESCESCEEALPFLRGLGNILSQPDTAPLAPKHKTTVADLLLSRIDDASLVVRNEVVAVMGKMDPNYIVRDLRVGCACLCVVHRGELYSPRTP